MLITGRPVFMLFWLSRVSESRPIPLFCIAMSALAHSDWRLLTGLASAIPSYCSKRLPDLLTSKTPSLGSRPTNGAASCPAMTPNTEKPMHGLLTHSSAPAEGDRPQVIG